MRFLAAWSSSRLRAHGGSRTSRQEPRLSIPHEEPGAQQVPAVAEHDPSHLQRAGCRGGYNWRSGIF